MFIILQGLPHPLHSAELLLQLIAKISSRPTSERTTSVMFSNENEPSTNKEDGLNYCEVTHHLPDEKSCSVLATVAKDVQQWALQHAYSSSWIKHFQFST